MARVERLLQQLVLDHQLGHREGSAISNANLVSAEEGDEDIWRQIARELDDVGITSDLVREHRTYITDWIKMALETGELAEASPSSDSIRGSESGIEADVYGTSPSSSLSPMPIELPASKTWPPNSQEGILPYYDVTLEMLSQLGSYSCNLCKNGGIFTTWFQVLSHARTRHDAGWGSGKEPLTLATLLHYPSSRDNDAVNELTFTMTSLFHALEEQLIPSSLPLLIYDLYYSETCPFSECLAKSRSPELNRYLASNPSILDY